MTLHQTKLRALDFIRDHVLAKGESPTIQEIAWGIGQSSAGSMHRIVAMLEAEGRIRRTPGKRRSIELVPVSGIICVELPPHLYAQVEAVARKADVTLAAVVIEAVRDGFKHFRSAHVLKSDDRETSGATNGQAEPQPLGQRRAEPEPHPQHDSH